MKTLTKIALIGSLGLTACGPMTKPDHEKNMNSFMESAAGWYLWDNCNGSQERWNENRTNLPSDGIVDRIQVPNSGPVYYDPTCPANQEFGGNNMALPFPPVLQSAASELMQATREFDFAMATVNYERDQARRAKQ